MRTFSAAAFRYVTPVFQLPAIRTRLEVIDENFFVAASAATLFATFLLWAMV